MLILDESTTTNIRQYGKDVNGDVNGGKINRIEWENGWMG